LRCLSAGRRPALALGAASRGVLVERFTSPRIERCFRQGPRNGDTLARPGWLRLAVLSAVSGPNDPVLSAIVLRPLGAIFRAFWCFARRCFGSGHAPLCGPGLRPLSAGTSLAQPWRGLGLRSIDHGGSRCRPVGTPSHARGAVPCFFSLGIIAALPV